MFKNKGKCLKISWKKVMARASRIRGIRKNFFKNKKINRNEEKI